MCIRDSISNSVKFITMKKVMSLPTGLTQQGQRISGSKYFNKQIICMTTSEIAKRLYELCSSKLLAQAQMELYSDDSVSIEPSNAQWGLMTVKGKKAVMQKGRDFMTLVTEWNGAFTGQPIIYLSLIHISEPTRLLS